MSFSHVSNLLKQNFDKNVEKYGQLFTVELDRDELWGLYLGSFPEGTNPLYRTRTEHDCSCCRHFLKNIGPTVWIDDDLNLHTIFEFDTGHPNEYQPVMDALDAFVKKTRDQRYLPERGKLCRYRDVRRPVRCGDCTVQPLQSRTAGKHALPWQLNRHNAR